MQAQPKYSPDDTQPLAPLAALLADALAQRTALPEPGHGEGEGHLGFLSPSPACVCTHCGMPEVDCAAAEGYGFVALDVRSLRAHLYKQTNVGDAARALSDALTLFVESQI